MKIKTILISLTLTAAVGGGSVYGAYRYSISHRTPVQVTSVENANIGSWFFYDDSDSESAMEGTIFTRSVQNVTRDTQYTLAEVYVQEGDEVKVGDKLMEYDMTLQELKKEKAEIEKAYYEITLSKTEKALEAFKANPTSASLSQVDDDGLDADDDDSDDTASSGETLIEDDEEADASAASAAEAGSDDAAGSTQSEVQETAAQEDSAAQEQTETQTQAAVQEQTSAQADDDAADVIDTQEDSDMSVQTETDAQADTSDEILEEDQDADYGDLIEDEDADVDILEDDEAVDDDDGDDEWIFALDSSSQILYLLTEFRTMENRLSIAYEDDPAALNLQTIQEALAIYQGDLAEVPSENAGTLLKVDPDVFGKSRQVRIYLISDVLTDVLQDTFVDDDGSTDTTKVYRQEEKLYVSYLKVLYYDFVYKMELIRSSLDAAGVTAETMTDDQVRSLSTQIEAAVTSCYAFQAEWKAVSQLLMDRFDYTQEEIDELYEKYFRVRVRLYLGEAEDITVSTALILPLLAARLNELEVVEETETETETESVSESVSEDFGGYDDGFDDYGDDGSDVTSLTQEEIQEQIKSYEDSIAEMKLNIREVEITIRKYERILDGQVVKATIDGIVKQAGSVSGSSGSNNFIVVTGEEGMYVSISVNELKRDSLSIGNTVTVTDYDTGNTYSGVVTEISEYPTDSSSSGSYWWGSSESDNPNASFYPVVAYIEQADGLSADSSYVSVTIDTSDSSASSNGIYLESYMVRTDQQGQSYVYVRGDDGLLEKRYVKTGAGMYGYGIQIKSGLSKTDYIAFPYGKNVVEGASTVEVDSLDE